MKQNELVVADTVKAALQPGSTWVTLGDCWRHDIRRRGLTTSAAASVSPGHAGAVLGHASSALRAGAADRSGRAPVRVAQTLPQSSATAAAAARQLQAAGRNRRFVAAVVGHPLDDSVLLLLPRGVVGSSPGFSARTLTYLRYCIETASLLANAKSVGGEQLPRSFKPPPMSFHSPAETDRRTDRPTTSPPHVPCHRPAFAHGPSEPSASMPFGCRQRLARRPPVVPKFRS